MNGTAELVDARRIWDAAPHNAFTDLLRVNDQWYCVFREGQAHVSPDGALRVIRSDDGRHWESAALLTSPTADLRDAKLSLTPDGRLMLSGAACETVAGRQPHEKTLQSFTWFSSNGVDWDGPYSIGDPDFWLWRTVWHAGVAYAVGYGCFNEKGKARLYTSTDGVTFTTRVETLLEGSYPNETALLFGEDGTACCLLRRDEGTCSALLGLSQPPYTEWEWKDLHVRVGGPQMLRLPDGRLVAAVRLYDHAVRTSLCLLDPDTGTLTEMLALPSGGDTSYAGMVWHDELLWISYYSSHKEKTSIYLAQVSI